MHNSNSHTKVCDAWNTDYAPEQTVTSSSERKRKVLYQSSNGTRTTKGFYPIADNREINPVKEAS